MAKTAPRPTKSAKKSAARKPAAKTAQRPAKKAARAPEAPRTNEALLAQLAKATKLSEAQVLQRALHAFAAAHGLALAAEAAPQLPQEIAQQLAQQAAQPAPQASEAAAHAAPQSAAQPAADDEAPALAPNVRLYVHGTGRPPQEMIRNTFFIGSSPKSDLWVNAPRIETRHLRIDREGDKYFVTDLSTSGTILHGEQIPPRYELKHEDPLYLAGYHLVRFYLLS